MTGSEIYCKVCTVDSVDEKARTVDCTPLDESAPLVGVNLQANQEGDTGVVCFPAVGELRHRGVHHPGRGGRGSVRQDRQGPALDRQDADHRGRRSGGRLPRRHLLPNHSRGVQFNGGKLGGLLKIEQLTEKFNELIRAFNTHTHTIPVGGVPVTGTAAAQSNPAPVVVPAVTQAMPEVRASDYEDAKVKH